MSLVHDWCQLDQGEGYCLKCGSTKPESNCRQAKSSTERKPQDYDKNSEIEKIKRQLAQLIDRVDALKKA